MKLLYDISLLGLGYYDTRARSGIFRVIENVAKELIKIPECDISFCSLNGLDNLNQALDYYETVPELKKRPFVIHRKGYVQKKRYQYKLNMLREKLASGEIISPSAKLFTKVKIQQARVLRRLSPYGDRKIFPAEQVNKADIYHATHFPVPEEVQKSKVKKCFINCYDLIPIKRPEYCDEGTVRRMINFLTTLTPDTWILCISKSARNDLLEYMGNKIDPAKAIVTELAAADFFYKSNNLELNALVRKRYHIPDGPFILSLCTLEPRKNIEGTIAAFVNLVEQQHLTDLSLVLVGNKGFNAQQLIDGINCSNNIKGRIIITGFVVDQDLASLYSEALMFVYPSFYEGFGLPPLEAMQCGTPVITSNTTSLPEVVGDAGIMVDPTDTVALCQAMWQLYSQPVLRQQLSEKSLKRAAGFSWKRCAEETMAAYKSSLNQT